MRLRRATPAHRHVSSMPDEQNPHCAAFRSMNARLQLLELAALRHAFDRVDGLAGDLGCERQAAAHRPIVDQNRAGATDAVLATEMRAGQLQLLAQEISEMLARLHAPLDRPAIDGGLDLDFFEAERDRGRSCSDPDGCQCVEHAPRQDLGHVQARVRAQARHVVGRQVVCDRRIEGGRRRRSELQPRDRGRNRSGDFGAVDAAEIDEPRILDPAASERGDRRESDQREVAVAPRQLGKRDRCVGVRNAEISPR